jgi:hypothetical protein
MVQLDATGFWPNAGGGQLYRRRRCPSGRVGLPREGWRGRGGLGTEPQVPSPFVSERSKGCGRPFACRLTRGRGPRPSLGE